MSQYRTILVITDPGLAESPAISRAAWLARSTGATLHLCVIEHSAGIEALRHVNPDPMQALVDGRINARMEWLRGRCEPLAHEGVRCDYSAIWGHPAEQMIVAKVLDLQPDLVLKDVHAVLAPARLFHTPLDWQLLRLCPAPLMLVNAHAQRLPRRVIAAVDPMVTDAEAAELNDRVLEGARALAIQSDAELHAIHVFALLPTVSESLAYARVQEQLRSAHERAFNALMNRHSVPADRRHFLEHVFVESAIREFTTEHHTDVLVMGSVYRSRLDRLLMGSTAEATLYRVNCDVLVLKPKGFLVDAAHWFNATVNQGLHYTTAA